MRLDLATGMSLATLLAVPALVQAQSIDELFRQGDAAQAAGDYATAEAIWRQIIQQDPENISAHNQLGINLAIQGNWDAAESIFRLAISIDPEYVSAYTNLGRVLYQQGQLEEAINILQNALQIDPTEIIAIYELGNIMADLGDINAAEELYVQAIATNPYFANAKYGLALLRIEQESYNEAISLFRELVDINPENINYYIGLGVSLTLQGQLDAAENAYLEAISRFPDSAFPAYNNLGYLYYQEGRYQRALDLYHRALSIRPNETAVRTNLEELRRAVRVDDLNASELTEAVSWLPSNEPFFRLRRSVVRIITHHVEGIERGTGWVVKRDGDELWILTNLHVVTSEQFQNTSGNIEVEFYSRPPEGIPRLRLPAEIVEQSTDEDIDLALLIVKNSPLDIQPLSISEGRVEILENLLVIGHPSGSENYWTVGQGEVSNISDGELILSDISLGYESSGSPVLNDEESVVGLIFEAREVVTAGFGIGYTIDFMRPILEEWGVFD